MRTGAAAILVLLSVVSAGAQEPATPGPRPARTVVLEIDIIDISVDLMGEIEKVIKDKRVLDRLTAEGKARPVAHIQTRARTGESATSRIGQRIPIQASTTAQGTSQVQYDNTGLSVDFTPRLIDADRILVSLKIELSTVVRNGNILAPTFIQRTVTDVVTLRGGEPTLLLSVTQHEGLVPSQSRTDSKPGEPAGGNFVIVLNARLLE
jgi:Flp pilus assembly secretin CpaC